MSYKELSKYEKLAEIQDLNFCRIERHNIAVYLKALWLNDRIVIDEYESFGDTVRQLLMNKRDYDQHLLFGFTEKKFNEYGWLENPKFLDVEELGFPHKDGWAVSNHITIGRGVNRKWTYGLSYSCGNGGYGFGIGVWGKIFDTRKECLSTALQEMMSGHKEATKDKYSAIVFHQAKELFDTLTGKKAVQLSLF